jgi:CubicO group peptidase (beta-lactamase class C family)
VDGIVQDGENLTFINREPSGKVAQRFNGRYNKDGNVISVNFGSAFDGTYDFTPATDQSNFYPRGRLPESYVYATPVKREDGWEVGSLGAASISRRGIEAFVQRLLSESMESPDAPQVDAVLVARHGKLVLEEYFHGWNRGRIHNTRSAGKSVTSALVGAAIPGGAPLALSSSVYEVMSAGATTSQELDPRKRRMTLENLLTMSSGFFCNDSNPEAPGNEEAMLNQTAEPDFYRYSLRVPMDRTPGDRAVYCSADANLALGMLSYSTGEHVMDLFERLLARPLGINQSAWYLSPSRQPYGGGSFVITPRDFLKIGQMMLDGGVWNGRRILDKSFVQKLSSPLHQLKNLDYGYLWWGVEWPYKGRTVRGYFAGGNGGQAIIVIPELALVIGIFGSSYNSRVGLEIQQGYAPRYILPSVDFYGDIPPVEEYEVIYGLSPSR